MAITVSDLRTSFDLYKKDTSDVSQALFVQWCDYMNKYLYRALIGVDAERKIKDYSFTITSGNTQYSLPADFRDVSSWECGLFERNGDGSVSDRPIPRSREGSGTMGYYLADGYLYITPSPQKDSYVYLRYTPKTTDITSVSDSFSDIIPDEYKWDLVYAIDTLYTQWDEDTTSESFADMRFVRMMDELIRTMNREPKAYFTDDFSVTF